VKAFAELLDRLSYAPQRLTKLRLLAAYLRDTPDPDRGLAVAVLTDGLGLRLPVRRLVAELMAGRVDPHLYRLSRDYVGDTAETVALLWGDTAPQPAPRLAALVEAIRVSPRPALAPMLAAALDALDPTGRWALLKLLTGAPRVGVSARLAKTALAETFGRSVDEIEEVWHGVAPPYLPLFAWLEGRGPRPDTSGQPVFRPLMLAHPLPENGLDDLDLGAFQVEWKWDGIRVQIATGGGDTRVYSRTGDDIGRSFPEIVAAFASLSDTVVDGELLVVRGGEVAPFAELQQRLNRKSVTRPDLDRRPAHVRLYDALRLAGEDLRPLALVERRRRLEAWYAERRPSLTDLSAIVAVADRAGLAALWETARASGIEGLMLKRKASPYLAGRPVGHWYKLKRAPLTADCVLMYAQRGSGKRSSYFSDFTFGAWRTGNGDVDELVPVGKAYSGFTDEELKALDRWVREHETERFGPVRAVEPGLVVEVAFDAVSRSGRHKSGIAMRFPRISRIRWDKPAAEAERLEALVSLIEEGGR
jgi:DNA ligase-1